MAKLWVTNSADKTKVPFLRGILTRTLTDAGLSFDEAYALSSKVRNRFEDKGSVSTEELRQIVMEQLKEHHSEEAAMAYMHAESAVFNVLVKDTDGDWSPFYRSQHMRDLESCGLSQAEAAESTDAILNILHEQETTELAVTVLGRITYDYLQDHYGKKIAHRYMVWFDHLQSGRPLIVLVGGTTGTGKSTIATEVAHRLGIVRTQSTDMLREVMRMMIPERLLPVLHVPSFCAGDALPGEFNGEDDGESVAHGYLTQSELLAVSCEAVVQRALRERVSLILEGVHVHPSLLSRLNVGDNAIVVMVMLAILKPKQLKSRLSARLLEAPERNSSGHLTRFEKIWQMQSFLLSEADSNGIQILSNEDKEHVTNRVMKSVIDELATSFDSTPKQVFSA